MQHPKEILKKIGLSPKKFLGQNFLVSEQTTDKILDTARLRSEDIVLEVGSGLGVLTRKMAERVAKVIAVEKDQELADWLEKELESFPNVEIVAGDILEINRDWRLEIDEQHKVVSNLPFNISKIVIKKLLQKYNPPTEMTLMVQKEVAESICSQPPKMDLISVAVQLYAEPEYVQTVPRNHFWPQPKVNAAIIRLTTRPSYWRARTEKERRFVNQELFFKLARAGFGHRRKQLTGLLQKELGLDRQKVIKLLKECDINPKARAETLSVQKWMELTEKVEKEVHLA